MTSCAKADYLLQNCCGCMPIWPPCIYSSCIWSFCIASSVRLANAVEGHPPIQQPSVCSLFWFDHASIWYCVVQPVFTLTALSDLTSACMLIKAFSIKGLYSAYATVSIVFNCAVLVVRALPATISTSSC
eukprot:GHRR01030354.1.p1 GENE.GHRR01030354.1~~GHRR01030354.1.p1  ORF type:complete len:130 (+),score=9.87 GHRR01030354.1:156-545(+)